MAKDKSWIIYLFIITALILFFIQIGYNLGYESANPCIEFEEECEMECWGEGTDAYDCECIYPCKKRKFDEL